MARPPTGQVLERRGKRGRTFAIRFRAYGKRRYLTTTAATRTEAEEELGRTLAAVKLGIWRAPVTEELEQLSEVPNFWAFAKRWYEQKELEVNERTREHILWALNGHLVWFGQYRVDEITAELVDSYRAHKLREGALCPESINKTLRLLAKILDKAVRRKYLESNPARGEDCRLRTRTPHRTWLELDEVRSLLEAAGTYRRELATLTLAGLRISELGGLRWRSVDLAGGTLTVEESKTEAGEWREIDLTPVLLEELKLYRAENPHTGRDELVFPTSKGRSRDRSNSRGRLLTVLKRANKERAEEGLSPIMHVTNHTLRRTFASLLYEAGAEPTDVMDQMGHKSSALALEVYARRMKRPRDTGARMDELVDWAQRGTNGLNGGGNVAVLDTEKERAPAL